VRDAELSMMSPEFQPPDEAVAKWLEPFRGADRCGEVKMGRAAVGA
jgi:hypothetical protein